MENKNENAQTKKTWITPELITESVGGTEGKPGVYGSEFTTPTFGFSAGPS